MKKLIAIVALFGVLSFGATQNLMAQEVEATADAEQVEAVAEETAAVEADAVAADYEEEVVEQPLHQAIKIKFIEGGAGFMALVVISLI